MMAIDVQWTIFASVLTLVSNHSAWRFVWSNEKRTQEGEESSSIMRILLDVIIPMLPTLIVLMGSDRLYDDNFTKVALYVLYSLVGILVTGATLSGLAWKIKQDDGAESRALIGEEGDYLPEESLKHLNWTLTLSSVSALFWWALLIRL